MVTSNDRRSWKQTEVKKTHTAQINSVVDGKSFVLQLNFLLVAAGNANARINIKNFYSIKMFLLLFAVLFFSNHWNKK